MKAKLKSLLMECLEHPVIKLPLLRLSNQFFAIPHPEESTNQYDYYVQEKNQGVANQKVIPVYPHYIWPHWVQHCYPESAQNMNNSTPTSLNNQTERNWITLKSPLSDTFVTIDESGLISPLNRWSIEFWISEENKELVILPLTTTPKITLYHNKPQVKITYTLENAHLDCHLFINSEGTLSYCDITLKNTAKATLNATVYVAIRPYNTLGIVPIQDICYTSSHALIIDNKLGLLCDPKPSNIICTDFENSHFKNNVSKWEMMLQASCKNQLASGVLAFECQLKENQSKTINCTLPLEHNGRLKPFFKKGLNSYQQRVLQESIDEIRAQNRDEALVAMSDYWSAHHAQFKINTPNKTINERLEQSILHCLTHIKTPLEQPHYSHTPLHNQYFLLNTLIKITNEKTLNDLIGSPLSYLEKQIPKHITPKECPESLGQYLMMIATLFNLTDDPNLIDQYKNTIDTLIKQIQNKVSKGKNTPFKNMLKPHTSFDGNGHKDIYFWDNFWVIGGLNQLIKAYKKLDKMNEIPVIMTLYKQLLKGCAQNISLILKDQFENLFIPTSASRILDSSMIHSLIGVYPLNIIKANDKKISESLAMIQKYHTKEGLFYSSSGPSGYSPYLNLRLANIFIKQEHPLAFKLLDRITQLATSTGTWPEYIHPITWKGTFGSGHDLLANCEYISLIASMCVNDEEKSIQLCPCIPKEWAKQLEVSHLNTSFGPLSFTLTTDEKQFKIKFQSEFKHNPKEIKIKLPHTIKAIDRTIPSAKFQDNWVTLPTHSQFELTGEFKNDSTPSKKPIQKQNLHA